MNTNYSILVNTTDSFEDCWIPFFSLFKKYWPNYSGKIYLNTERKLFKYSGLNIISIQNSINRPQKKITWSECLCIALNSIETDVILYMQEDYFLKDYVKDNLIDKYVDLVNQNNEINCIHLTDQAVIAEKQSDKFKDLYFLIKKQRYLISCQAALWRKDVLFSYLRTYEDAWQFEEFGSKRASKVNSGFFVVDNSLVQINKFELIPYVFTGIIQGRWYEEVVPLFKSNNILVDYSKRGFVSEALNRPLRLKLIYQIKRLKCIYLNFKDLHKKLK